MEERKVKSRGGGKGKEGEGVGEKLLLNAFVALLFVWSSTCLFEH